MRNVLGYLVVFAFFLSSVVELEAATICVPADQLTIQAGINAASRGTWSSTAGSCNCEQRELHSLPPDLHDHGNRIGCCRKYHDHKGELHRLQMRESL